MAHHDRKHRTKSRNRRRGIMKGTTKVAKGRIEEAAGVLAGNDRLRAKGQTDQAVGHVKQAVETGVRQVKESARKIADKSVK
jgi:uncharacterized protein YjbJ (UPF0337 family)